jgi:glycosyltransferase involved in cell wall biosynthesis
LTKVSIGVCVKNGEKFIVNAINSILDQDFSHNQMEVIFVDDGSTDRTLQIMNDYAQKMDITAKVFTHEWKGLGATRNVVLNHATGEYIIWVDSDMVLTKSFVRKQVTFMDKNPTVGIAKGSYGLYETSSLVAYLENVDAKVKQLEVTEVFSEALGTGGSIYRIEALRKIGGFDEKITGVGEDMDAEHRISKDGWLLKVTPAEFYEIRRTSLGDLWKEYLWHGSGGGQIVHKVDPKSLLYRLFPPTAILTEFIRSRTAYKISHRKIVFLLPLHWVFKRISWSFGFAIWRIKN